MWSFALFSAILEAPPLGDSPNQTKPKVTHHPSGCSVRSASAIEGDSSAPLVRSGVHQNRPKVTHCPPGLHIWSAAAGWGDSQAPQPGVGFTKPNQRQHLVVPNVTLRSFAPHNWKPLHQWRGDNPVDQPGGGFTKPNQRSPNRRSCLKHLCLVWQGLIQTLQLIAQKDRFSAVVGFGSSSLPPLDSTTIMATFFLCIKILLFSVRS